MACIELKIIPPSYPVPIISQNISEDVTLKELFEMLIDMKVLFNTSSTYVGYLISFFEEKKLDNEKTLVANGIVANDTLLIVDLWEEFIGRQRKYLKMNYYSKKHFEELNLKIVHPTNNSDLDISVSEEISLKRVIEELIDIGFLSKEDGYGGVLAPYRKRKYSFIVDNEIPLGANGIENDATIQICKFF